MLILWASFIGLLAYLVSIAESSSCIHSIIEIDFVC